MARFVIQLQNSCVAERSHEYWQVIYINVSGALAYMLLITVLAAEIQWNMQLHIFGQILQGSD